MKCTNACSCSGWKIAADIESSDENLLDLNDELTLSDDSEQDDSED